LLLIATIGALAAFYTQIYEPLAHHDAELATERDGLRTDRDALEERATRAESERDTARQEADAARAERDALRAREAELSGAVQERDAQIAQLSALQEALEEQLRGDIASGDVSVEQRNGRVAVRMADQVLFAPGHAELSGRGQAVLRRVATSLARLEDRVVQVEGHTDSTPLEGGPDAPFATNWELSVARATNVVRFLQDECGMPGERLVAAGLSQYRPAADNATATGRRRNRRIELTLLPMPR